MIEAIGRFYDRIRALPQPIRTLCLPLGLAGRLVRRSGSPHS
jgi:hypothetical protein